MNCNICNKRINNYYLMCDKCHGVSYLSCTIHKKNRHYRPTNTCDTVSTISCARHKSKRWHPQTNISIQNCHLCNKPCTPTNLSVQNSYNNLRNILKPKGYYFGKLRTTSSLSHQWTQNIFESYGPTLTFPHQRTQNSLKTTF